MDQRENFLIRLLPCDPALVSLFFWMPSLFTSHSGDHSWPNKLRKMCQVLHLGRSIPDAQVSPKTYLTWCVFFLFFFFDVGHFQSLYWICYSIASVLCFCFLAKTGIWDLSSPSRNQTCTPCIGRPSRNQTCTPCIGRQSLNHWTAREVPDVFFYRIILAFWYQLIPCLSALGTANIGPLN